jgi:hypothetical protein
MALKSYCGNKKSAFESEKDAFSALKSNIDVPIVRYLGSFTHDYGEGITSADHHARKTYNLLLEYGELDLYQYWADETNVPPVRVNEIIRYWEQLFEVAVAIRQVHHLDVSQGKSAPLSYYGYVTTAHHTSCFSLIDSGGTLISSLITFSSSTVDSS